MFGYTCLSHTHAGFIYCVLARVGYGLARSSLGSMGVSIGSRSVQVRALGI